MHTRSQNVAMVDTETGKVVERQLENENGERRGFYAGLPAPVRVGIEPTGHTQGFEGMLSEVGHENWVRKMGKVLQKAVADNV